MSTRIKSAAVAIVIAVILLIAHGTFLFNIAVGAISALAIYEIFRATKMTEHKYQTIACCAFAFVDAFMPVFYRHGWLYFFSYKLYMGLFVIAMCLLYLKEHTKFQYTEFFFMLGVGMLGCKGFAQISRLSDAILIPSIFLLCVVGSYAIHNNVVEVAIMLIFGVIGYLARKFDFNAAAIVLGLILGPIGERGLRRSLLISDGDPSILFSTSLCWILIALCVLGVLSPLLMERMERRMRESAES